jgi:predicted PurR-regulated permease PerM
MVLNDKEYFRKVMNVVILLVIAVLAFLVLRPILLYIVLGFILAFIFSPIYNSIYKLTKAPNFSATIVSIILFIILAFPLWFFTPLLIDEAFKIYLAAQETDFVGILKGLFPSVFASEQFSAEIGSTIQSFVSSLANSALNYLSKIIINFPTILLNALVSLFSFFFVLRDKDKLMDYIKSLLPFSKDIENKLFKSSKDITASVLYGQVILGIIQGLVVGIGFLVFGIESAWVLGAIAIVAGILPIVGPMFVWVPVCIFLLINGDLVASLGIFVFGVVGSNIDTLLRPYFVSRYTKIHSAVVLIGMIGGLFMFGILGLILGPLVLAYLLIILEVYRSRGSSKAGITTTLIKTE